MAKNNQIEVNGIDIKYKKINKADYISLTDIARGKLQNESPVCKTKIPFCK